MYFLTHPLGMRIFYLPYPLPVQARGNPYGLGYIYMKGSLRASRDYRPSPCDGHVQRIQKGIPGLGFKWFPTPARTIFSPSGLSLLNLGVYISSLSTIALSKCITRVLDNGMK